MRQRERFRFAPRRRACADRLSARSEIVQSTHPSEPRRDARLATEAGTLARVDFGPLTARWRSDRTGSR
jgi:hypothetical protein